MSVGRIDVAGSMRFVDLWSPNGGQFWTTSCTIDFHSSCSRPPAWLLFVVRVLEVLSPLLCKKSFRTRCRFDSSWVATPPNQMSN